MAQPRNAAEGLVKFVGFGFLVLVFWGFEACGRNSKVGVQVRLQSGGTKKL